MLQSRQMELRGLIFSQYQNLRQMARVLGWDASKLSRIVTGKQMATIQDAVDMADVLGVDVRRIIKFFSEESHKNGNKEVSA